MTDTEIEARLREMLSESGIDGEGAEELVARLRELERYVDEDPPEPSPQLAAMMAGLARNVVAAPFGGRRRTRLFIAGCAAFGTVAAGGIAAAANELPPAAQTIVAEFSETYLPFELPYPDEKREQHPDNPDEETVFTTDGDDSGGGLGDPSLSPLGSQTIAEEPTTAEPSAAPTPSAVATPTTAPTVVTTEPTVPPTEPSVAPDPSSDVPTDVPTDGDPQAGESPSADPSSGSPEPSASPSGSPSPSPTANTRTESSDSPSSSPSPSSSSSSSPSGTSSPSPSPSPSAVWTDQ